MKNDIEYMHGKISGVGTPEDLADKLVKNEEASKEE